MMIRILYILIIMSFSSCSLNAQDESLFTDYSTVQPSFHHKRDFSIFLSTAYLSANHPYNSTLSGGLKMRMFLGERFSFDSGFLIGKDHAEWGWGLLGIPIWMLGAGFIYDDEGYFNTGLIEILLVGAVMLLSAEHVAYHIPVHDQLEISPYVSLLRMKEFSDVANADITDGYVGATCFALGIEANTYFKKFVVSPYIDYNIAYSGDFRGLNFGINLGYYIPSKRR
ncbi:hypothetical protein [Maribellus sediminis]|uniref:hypothetical protein n=1 Tax=Maribellus sediminis TaxID=2696285 RepID=UPI001431371E|nr:hypothetical protein [Maribellus sediminis]